MSGSSRSIAIRLSAQGASDVRAQLEGIGSAGAAAMKQVSIATDDLAKTLEAAGNAVAKLHEGLGQQTEAASNAATGMAEAAKATSDHAEATGQAAQSGTELTTVLRVAAEAYAAARVASSVSATSATAAAGAFSGVRAAIAGVAAVIGPAGLAIGALAAATGFAVSVVNKFDTENQTLANTLRAVGRDAEIATGNLRGYVEALQAQGVSQASATSVVDNLVRTPAISERDIARVTSVVKGLAAALGTDLSAAATKAGEAFSGTYGGVKALDDALNFLTRDERDQIRVFLEHGDRVDALDLEFAALKRRIEGMDESMTGPFEKAMRRLSVAWQQFTDTIAQDPNVRAIIDWASQAGAGVLSYASSAVTSVSSGSAFSAVRDWLAARLSSAQPGSAAAGVANYLRPPTDAARFAALDFTTPPVADPGAFAAMDANTSAAQAADLQRQLKLVETLTASQRINAQVAAVAADKQAELRARLMAEQEAADHGLTGMAREELIRARVAAATDKQSKATQDHTRTIAFYIAEAEGQAKALLAQADAYDQRGAEVMRAVAAEKAEKEARALAQQDHEATAAQVQELTDKYVALAQAQEQVREAQNIQSKQDQLAYIQREKELLTARADVRERELAIIKETQRILAAGGDPTTGRGARSVSLAGEVAQATAEMNKQKQVIADLSRMASDAFDQIGTAISNAFATGSVVKWGAVVRTVISSVMQQVLKLAIINPLVNSIVGSDRTTLSQAVSVLGGGSGLTSGTGGGMLSDLGNLLGLGSSGAKLFGYDITGGLTNSLGLGGILGTQLWGGTMLSTSGATAGLTVPLAAADDFATAGGATALSGATLGSLLGGVGLGFGAGTLLNSLVGGHQTGGTIGSGVGATAGAIIGSFIPVIGTLLGGLIGGLAGGGLGGLFGPTAHHGWGYHVKVDDNGQLVMTNIAMGKADAAGQQQYANDKKALQQFDAWMTQVGLAAKGTYIVGANNTGVDEVPSLMAGLSRLTFSATGANPDQAILNQILKDRKFKTATDLQTAVTFASTYDTLMGTTKTTNIGALQTQIDALNKSFADAITKAKEYGLAETNLANARDKQIQALKDEAAQMVADLGKGYDVRLARARGDNKTADLVVFDANAAAEQTALVDQLTAAFGDAYKATAEYAAITGKLNDTLAAERKAIEDQYAAQAAAQQKANAASGHSLLMSLTLGAQSALAPEQQYFAGLSLLNDARHTLDAGGTLADYTAIAQQVLPVARDYLGTSQRYASLVSDVASVVSSHGGDIAGLGSLLQAQVDGTDALRDTLAKYGQQQVDVASATLTEIRRLASTIEALIARKLAA